MVYASAKPIYGNWNFPKIPSRNLIKLSLAYEMDFGRHLKALPIRFVINALCKHRRP